MARQKYKSIPALLDWISDTGRRADLAVATDRSPDYLYQIAAGWRRASPDLATSIEAETGGKVSKEIMVWPERMPTSSKKKVGNSRAA